MKPRTLAEQEDHLVAVISSDRFLNMQGLGGELPFWIYPYPPADTLEIDAARGRIINKLRNKGINPVEINLYDVAIDAIKEFGAFEQLLEIEPDTDKDAFLEALQGLLDPASELAPRIAQLVADSSPQVVFITGSGEVFPFIRTHNVLNALHSAINDVPVVTWFPGAYEQSDTQGSSLDLFGLIHDDQYYRARDIRFQEI